MILQGFLCWHSETYPARVLRLLVLFPLSNMVLDLGDRMLMTRILPLRSRLLVTKIGAAYRRAFAGYLRYLIVKPSLLHKPLVNLAALVSS
jgi:hypothetical protein